MANHPPFVRSDILGDIPHGFFGHADEAFQYGYGAEGNVEAITSTRAAAATTLVVGASIMTPHQVHSPDVVTVTQAWDDNPAGRPVADALVTNQTGIAIGIVTADCGPVLLADAQAGVIGAAHAGWRGAHFGVLENTIAAMEALGAHRENITAAIGPTIAQPSYEVDKGFRAHFTGDAGAFFSAGKDADHWQFDLPAYIAHRLQGTGLTRIADLALDTYAHASDYYSYRRATHLGVANYGRQISAIALG